MNFSLVVFLIAAPWLNPFAPGPSPSVVPWLVTLGLTLVLAALAFSISSSKVAPTKDAKKLCAQPWVTALCAAWLIAGLLSSAMGLLQYFGLTHLVSPWVNPTNSGEAFANLRQRNQFATLTNIALVALVWLASQQQAPNKKVHFGLLLGAASLLAVGNAISSSRTGLFQLLLLCALSVLWGDLRRKDVRRLLLCAVLVYTLAMFALPWAAGLDLATHGAWARLGNDQACASRWVLWSNVLQLIGQKPGWGWGWGELDYAHFITLYDGPRFCDILDNAHNLPLQLAVELGVPLALLACGGFAGWAVRHKPWAERDRTRQMAWAVIAVILLHSMLEYPLWYGPFQVAFGVCVLILWRRPKVSALVLPSAESSQNTLVIMPIAHIKRALSAITIIASAICLAAVTYAAWDYHRVSQIYLQPESRHPTYQDNTLALAKNSWLFADQALFAELILTPLTPATAEWMYASAARLLHYSPEPRVVQKLIESAVMLGKDAEALAYLARFRAAFPAEHAAWAKANATTNGNLPPSTTIKAE